MNSELKALAEEWLRLDKDEVTRDEIYRLLVDGAYQELDKRLRPRIAFGTAGLRASMQAGFARMNSLTVIQASQGLAAYLLDQDPDVVRRGVVIGRDARHNSEKFAKLAAAVFVARGIKVWWLERELHTPMVPFGVSELNASAGVMITASHNPPQDNGYKVYWSNGSQIIPPHDAGIAAAITKNLEPTTWDVSAIDDGNLLVEGALALVADKYCKAIWKIAHPEGTAPPSYSDMKFVYTPMHGVGLLFMQRIVNQVGLHDSMVVVPSQAEPDPNFPTVKFPNPEEKGALNEAIHCAEQHSISLVLASDPDADRLAVAEKVNGQWHQFTGNQLGVLLASHVLSAYPSHKSKKKLAMLASTVSTRMLAAMAAYEGFHYNETLTGFKWLGNVARDLENEGYDVEFAFEEAIGYMFPRVVHDKDAIATAGVFLAAVSRWKEEKLTPWTKLQALYDKYGHFEDVNTYLVSPSSSVTNKVFDSIRELGTPYPKEVGSRRVVYWRDLTRGYDSATADHIPHLPVSSESQMITCELEDQVFFTVRGSGTEPKIKLYIEGKSETAEKARKAANEVLKDLLTIWFKPEENGLALA
jgi:phosphoglucomutase